MSLLFIFTEWSCLYDENVGKELLILLIHIVTDLKVLYLKWWVRCKIFVHTDTKYLLWKISRQYFRTSTPLVNSFVSEFFFAMQTCSQQFLIKLVWILLNSEKWYFTTIHNSFIFRTQWIYLCLDWAILLIIPDSSKVRISVTDSEIFFFMYVYTQFSSVLLFNKLPNYWKVPTFHIPSFAFFFHHAKFNILMLIHPCLFPSC